MSAVDPGTPKETESVAPGPFGPRWGDISIGGTWAEGVYNKKRTEISHHNGSGTLCLVFGCYRVPSEEVAKDVAAALSDWDRGLLKNAEARVRELEAALERIGSQSTGRLLSAMLTPGERLTVIAEEVRMAGRAVEGES